MAPTASAIPSRERLLTLVDRFANCPVLMVVDLVADRFVRGEPSRISREAPVLILRHTGETTTLGGGANTAANVKALGGEPLPLGLVGDDDSGRQLLRCLDDAGISTAGVLSRPGYRTPTKTRIVAGGRHAIKQQIVRLDVEEHREVTASEFTQLLSRLATWRGRASVGLLSDYGYGLVSPAWIGHLRDSLQADGPGRGLVLCDSRHRLAEFAGIDGATPNEEEAEMLHGGPLDPPGHPVAEAGGALRRLLAAQFLLITRGSRGMALCAETGTAEIPVHGTDQVADVTGAGDTVLGTFALSLAAGASPVEAALLANYAGGIVVMKMGTATLGPDELRHAIEIDPSPRERLRWSRA